MNLHDIHDSSGTRIREVCKEHLEALEHWMRRLIDDSLTSAYGDYFSFIDPLGNRLIRKSICDAAEHRVREEPLRFPRKIDATFLDDAIDIVCNPNLFKAHFRNALSGAFPDGCQEARTFMTRLLVPRNHLAHANAISIRQAEQVICYSNDIIESLKTHYRNLGMQDEYNVPLILKVTDSFGNVMVRSQMGSSPDGSTTRNFLNDSATYLRPGDTLTIEVEVDPSFSPESYSLNWTSTKPWSSDPITGPKVVIPISNRQVGSKFDVQCRLVTTNEWHRMNKCDDLLVLFYRVLPPI